MAYDNLKLENQLCFPLYACSKEVIRRYKPFLEELNLTYTQYLVMLVLWEKEGLSVKEIGEMLFLDSGTLTPVLKKLESQGIICRERSSKDERSIKINLTEKGLKLEESASDIPQKIGSCINLTKEEAMELYKLLYKAVELK